jgi:hypothetical protein
MAARTHTPDRSHRTRSAGSARIPIVGVTLVLLALAGALILWLRHAPTSIKATAVAPTPSGEMRTSALDSEQSEASQRRPEELVDPSTTSVPPSLVDADHAEIRGRFISDDGSPLPGVPIQLTARGASGTRARAHDDAEADKEVKAVSDERGRFSIVFVPSRAFGYDMSTAAEAFSPVRWSWESVAAGDQKDLGDIVLSKGGSIAGRILDVNGQPLVGQEWRIRARRAWIDLASGREPIEDPYLSDKTTSAFELTNLAPGPAQLSADRGGMCRFDGPIVDVRSGEVVHVDLTCPDADAASRISIVVTCPPYIVGPYATMKERHVSAIHLEGAERELTAKSDRSTDGFFFDDLAAGQYTVRIDDPRYVAWTSAPVEPGALVEARLKGSSSVRLSLVDAATETPITRCSVHAEVDDPLWRNWGSAFVPLLEDGDLARTGGVIDGLVPIAQTLIVSAPGYADAHVRGVILEEREVLPLNVRMSRGATLSGRVLTSDGRIPTADVVVRLETPFNPHRSLEGMLDDASGLRATKIDKTTGRFTFALLVPGRYHLQASSATAVHSAIVEAWADDDAQEVELRLPPVTRLRGRVLAPPNASFANVRLLIECKAFPGTSAEYGIISDLDWRRRLAIPIAPDGHYETGPLPAGEARATLITPDVDLPNGFHGSGHCAGSTLDLGTLVLSSDEWNEHDFDTRAAYFGAIGVTLALDRQNSSGCVVTACKVESRYMVEIAGAVVGRSGSVELGPILPGDYAIVVVARDAGWTWVAPGIVHVTSASHAHESYHIQLAEGTIRIGVQGEPHFDPTNRFSVRADVQLPVQSTFLEPAADGSFRLVMPVGRYVLRFVSWTTGANAGSAPASNAAPRKDPTFTFDWPISSSGMHEFVFASGD